MITRYTSIRELRRIVRRTYVEQAMSAAISAASLLLARWLLSEPFSEPLSGFGLASAVLNLLAAINGCRWFMSSGRLRIIIREMIAARKESDLR